MENINKYMNYKQKIIKENYLKILLFKYLIIILYLRIVYPFLVTRNKFIIFSEINQILLRVKGKSTSQIIYPNFKSKPYIYYLNDETIPKKFIESSIDLPESENIVNLIFDDKVVDCRSMFNGSSNITEIDLSNFISSDIKHMNNMFNGCTSLKRIKFGNFQTSQVTYMENVFYRCSSLTTLDLSSFDTSKVTHFHQMFYGCSSLKYLDLSNFNTSLIECIHNMFTGCISITSINLSSFRTPKLLYMHNMFNNCKNLTSLDLSSFTLDSTQQIHNMFYNCEKLEFVNFKLAKMIDISNYNNMIANTAKNIVFCVDESKTPILNKLMESNSCSTRTSDCINWRKYQKKIIPELNKCLDNCPEDYPFENLGKCYNKCQLGKVNIDFICYDCISFGKCIEMTEIEFKNIVK